LRFPQSSFLWHLAFTLLAVGHSSGGPSARWLLDRYSGLQWRLSRYVRWRGPRIWGR